ncbi:MAG: DUF2183 domain-containing protein [Gammaproteobacteria bacterium]|nr:DUF2183 domain-containing protein [Gammaproteobacteria bacterium]
MSLSESGSVVIAAVLAPAIFSLALLSGCALANQEVPATDLDDPVPVIEAEPDEKPAWRSKLKDAAQTALADVEQFADVAWTRFSKRLGLGQPRHIANYYGYGNQDYVWVTGRVLANRPIGGPQEDDKWFDNLKASYQRWNSREVAEAEVNLFFNGETRTVTTDIEGYYHARFERRGDLRARDQVVAQIRPGQDDAITVVHEIYSPAPGSEVMIISDMDDTIIHTGITDLLVAAQLTFLNNAKTRQPLTGVAALYQALAAGPEGNKRNPVFYVSNSAWNMYDLLRDFVDLNDLPPGPIMLRDIGFDAPGEGSENHKIDTIRSLIRSYPDLPVILVGDSGQHDAEIYAEIAAEFPGRLLAIYIRDIDPDHETAFDAKVDAIMADSTGGVPFLRVANSALIAEHAATLGLLSQVQVANVSTETAIDRQREPLPEEAMEEAIAMTNENDNDNS